MGREFVDPGRAPGFGSHCNLSPIGCLVARYREIGGDWGGRGRCAVFVCHHANTAHRGDSRVSSDMLMGRCLHTLPGTKSMPGSVWTPFLWVLYS